MPLAVLIYLTYIFSQLPLTAQNLHRMVNVIHLRVSTDRALLPETKNSLCKGYFPGVLGQELIGTTG